jgi:cell division protein ZapA (FtsZ GTPase activity inhibitor)
MDQKINVKIAGRTFSLTASSPKEEELYRTAADAVTRRFNAVNRIFPGQTMADLMSLVALNETVIRLDLQKEIDQYKNQEKQLEKDLERYLSDSGE